MIPNIKEWTQEEAEANFKRIEETKDKREWYDIEWKIKLNFNDTGGKSNNTTQKAVSGFANTYGGNLVIGFDDNGLLIGTEQKSNIDNHISTCLASKLKGALPFFKTRYYSYKNRDVLVIFVAPCKIPIQCDNGVYYYREQSEFKQMPHKMIEHKFRANFEEEKYIFLLLKELEYLTNYLRNLKSMCCGPLNSTIAYRISPYTHIFYKCREKLFNFLKENNMLNDYFDLLRLINCFISDELVGVYHKYKEFYDLSEKVEGLRQMIEKAEDLKNAAQ